MENRILKLSIGTLLMFGGAMASADSIGSKARLKVDFNKMIQETNIQKSELKAELTNEVKVREENLKSQEKTVSDFVDMELEIGEAPSAPVVDRRFDSVDDAT